MPGVKNSHLLIAIAAALLLSGCGSKIEMLDSAKSPDGKYEAIAFIATGGGAAGWVNWFVEVYPTGAAKPLSSSHDEAQVLFATHIKDLKLKWQDKKLTILCEGCADEGRVWEEKAVWHGVTIERRDLPAPRNGS